MPLFGILSRFKTLYFKMDIFLIERLNRLQRKSVYVKQGVFITFK